MFRDSGLGQSFRHRANDNNTNIKIDDKNMDEKP